MSILALLMSEVGAVKLEQKAEHFQGPPGMVLSPYALLAQTSQPLMAIPAQPELMHN
jgi:hypothetical protein